MLQSFGEESRDCELGFVDSGGFCSFTSEFDAVVVHGDKCGSVVSEEDE